MLYVLLDKICTPNISYVTEIGIFKTMEEGLKEFENLFIKDDYKPDWSDTTSSDWMDHLNSEMVLGGDPEKDIMAGSTAFHHEIEHFFIVTIETNFIRRSISITRIA